MRRTREIVGLPILSLENGNQLGWVKDVVFDETGRKVAGVILESGHIFHSAQSIRSEFFAALGKDALTISNPVVQDFSGVKWSEKIGNQIFTQGGEAKGTIQDVFLDDSGQAILGYEISDGLFSDLMDGRSTILQEKIMVDGKDVLIVEDHVSPSNSNKRGVQYHELSGM